MRPKGSQFYKKTVQTDSPRSDTQTWRGRTSDEWVGERGFTDYEYHTQPGKMHANMRIQHRPATSYTKYPPASMLQADDSFDVDEYFPATGQMPLFTHQSNAASDELNVIGGTKSAQVPSMTMVGMAAKAAQDRGVPLMPAKNLSSHSIDLMEGLKNRGVNVGDVPSAPTNSLTFWDGPESEHNDIAVLGTARSGMTPIPEADVAGGRRVIRSIMGRNRPTGDQGTLF